MTNATNGINGNGHVTVHENGHGKAVKGSARLRQLLASDEIIALPGVYDGISARMAIAQGFQGLYMTGAGTTASRLGLPDLAFASQDDFVANASMIASLAPDLPLVCDADVGFGGPAQIRRTVERYDRAGVAALHIEDQVQTKRCGHLLGKQLVSADDFIVRIRAAALARDGIPGGSSIVIIARSDAAQGFGMDEAITRLRRAVEAGADVAFVEGMTSRADVEQAVKALAPTPVLLNLVHGGSTPDFTAKEAHEMGVKMVIYPGAGMIASALALQRAYALLKKTGTDKDVAEGHSPRDFFRMVGLDEALAFDELAGGKAYSGGV